MIAVNVKVPREMRDALNDVAKARKWSLAVTVREAIQLFVDEERRTNPKLKRLTPASPKS